MAKIGRMVNPEAEGAVPEVWTSARNPASSPSPL